MKKIGILGSGIVARTLGNGFLKHGYPVKMGTGTPGKLDEWLASRGSGGAVGNFAEAAAFGDIVVLAVQGEAAMTVLNSAGAVNLTGKTIIDTTNPIDHSRPPVNGVLRYFTDKEDSLMQHLQHEFPETNFVKAFNIVGNKYMVNPAFPEGKPTMFICGNNEAAKAEVTEILTQFGWDTEDMGKAESANCIESLCILWCIPGMLHNKWNHAFKLVKME
jgi:predicted dinucleotide-binding enzyme